MLSTGLSRISDAQPKSLADYLSLISNTVLSNVFAKYNVSEERNLYL